MLRAVFLFIVGLVTLAPLAQAITRVLPERSLSENRALAPWPAHVQASHAYVKGVGDWFNDNFGFRGLLVGIKNQIDYSVFNFSERVHIGRDNWLFYRSVIDVERPNAENYLSSNFDAVREGIAEVARVLNRSGIRMVLVVNEMSDRFYPEMVPSSALRTPTDTRLRALLRALKASDTPIFIDSTEILTEVAKVRPVFHKTDFHWNDPAGFAVAQAIVARLSAVEGRAATVWPHPLSIRTERFSGGIANFMPILWPPKEDGLMVAQNWTFPADFKQSGPQGIFGYSIHAGSTGKAQLGPVVVVGNSFSDAFVRSGMYMSFTDFYGAPWARMRSLSALAQELPADTKYVVVQMLEMQVRGWQAFADRADIGQFAQTIDSRFAGRP